METKLTTTQMGIYLECAAHPESTVYNISNIGRFAEKTDPDVLREALLKAVAAHPMINTVLCEASDGSIFLRESSKPFEISIRYVSENEFENLRGGLVRPFELIGGVLSRIEIFVTPDAVWLFEDFHHLICDGTSLHVLADDVRRALDGEQLKGESISPFSLAEEEDKWLASDDAVQAKAYWNGLLSGCESNFEPERDRWEEQRSQNWLFRSFDVDEERFAALRRTAGCSTTAFFASAFAYALSLFADNRDVIFAAINSGRSELTDGLFDMLVKTFPLRVQLEGCDEIASLLHGTTRQLTESRQNSAYPFISIVEEHGIAVNVSFAYQSSFAVNPMVSGSDIKVERVYDSSYVESSSMHIEILHTVSGRYDILFSHRTDRFSKDWGETFVEVFIQIVREFLSKQKLSEVCLVSRKITERLDAFNKTETPREEGLVIDLFRASAKKFPDKTAVSTGRVSYTYAEADRITDALAGELKKRGIGRGDVVSVLIPRDEFMALASYGVLKSGAAYQPLDPSYPEQRLQFMVSDAKASLIIADRGLIGKLGKTDIPVIFTDEILSLPDSEPFDAGILPDDTFVLLYTSGTTGTPKGSMVKHSNTAELVKWSFSYFGIDENSNIAAYASYGFDAHMTEIYPSLTCGGSLFIIPDEIRLDLKLIEEFFHAHSITYSVMTTQVGRQFAQVYKGGTLKHLMVGGEVLVPIDPDSVPFTLHNGYGPSECTVLCAIQPVDQLYHRIPIGKALENVKLYVVDKDLRRLPPYAPGELLIAGPRVGKGYLGLPEKTAAAFIKNRFSDDGEYSCAYRTGDIVRILGDGKLDFIGRKDGQVKVRGFRIELSEVEAVIREFPGITDATVQAFADERTGMKYLAAYVVSDEEIDIQAMNGYIKGKKPPYMVPSVTMQLDKIPLTTNNKVDKRALPIPQRKHEELVPPANEAEQKAFDCVCEALGHSDLGVTSDLAESGLTSISAMRLIVLLSEKFGKIVRISDLKGLNSIREITEKVLGSAESKTYELRELYPLSSVQKGIYIECMANPNTTIYNIPLLLKLDASVDTARLKEAVRKAANAHPYLKTRLVTDSSGEVMAKRDDSAEIPVQQKAKSELCIGFPELVSPFDLLNDQLVRMAVITDEDANYLFIDAHHIVFDGESLMILLRDIEAAYGGSELKTEVFTGFEAALDEEELRSSQAYEKAKAYYTALLDGAEPDCLPTRDRDDEVYGFGQYTADVKIDRQEIAKAISGSTLTENALWNSAFGLTLAKFLARESCVYTTVYNGRSDARLAESVGMYVHTLPVVCTLKDEENGKDLAARIAAQLSESMSNDIYSFAEISRTFGIKANILFVYEGSIGTELTVGGAPAVSVDLQPGTLKADITVFIFETDEGYRISFEYSARHYENWSIASLAAAMAEAFKAIVRSEKIGEISLLPAGERERIEANTLTTHKAEDTDVITLFRRMAAAHPDKDAVIFKDKHISYRELDERTDRLAAHIRSLGIGSGDVVSILIPRCEYMPIAALGVLKTGAAYQPLDPSYPSERLCFMVEDASAKLVIAEEDLLELLPSYTGSTLLLSDIPALPDVKPAPADIKPESLFILLYTSGTTGRPKGVMLEHRNLVNFCEWYKSALSLTPENVVGAYASFGFDACMMDMYSALTNGAAVFIVPEEMRMDLALLDKAFEENHVTHIFMTTQMGRLFAENMQGRSLKHLLVGGEALSPIAPDKNKNFKLWNCYGPTECTIFTTFTEIDRLYYRNPLGAPISNYRLYVVDKCGHELPVGAMGELWISGRGVGRGYLNLPELTENAFIRNPFSDDPEFSRVYRTGDIVRRLEDGSIDFIGRNDGQVKIRGFRIELPEVEGIIREYPGIRNVTVQAFDDKSFGGKFLAAYVVSDSPVDPEALGEFIKSKKPPYMVPASIIQLDEIPLNQNQKVNKRALPTPVRHAAATESVEPQTELERRICEEFGKILGIEKVGATDDFFELGGTSMSAAKVVMFAMNNGYPIVYKDVFDNPSARELAKVIEGASGGAKADPAADYDYTEINKLIAANSMDNIDDISASDIGNVILTGATGFLGIHVLKAFLDSTNGKITCLIRQNEASTSERRLKEMMLYYFGDIKYFEMFGTRIFCADGDITDPKSLASLDSTDARMVINCAACVKHFVNDDLLDRVNVQGVKNLIDYCEKHSMRLVHISTLSVAGELPGNDKRLLNENILYLGQSVENNYVRTKFLAERAILEERAKNKLDAVIMRVGNLMSRYSDGEFQINFITNAFMRSLWAYKQLGQCPVTVLETPVEFSPIDSTAQAILTLAGADKRFSIFHVNNDHMVSMADVIYAMRRYGFDIDIVSGEKFAETVSSITQNDDRSLTVLGLVAYAKKESEDLEMVGADHRFTVNALYRLGFKWPIISDPYLDNSIEALDSLSYFS